MPPSLPVSLLPLLLSSDPGGVIFTCDSFSAWLFSPVFALLTRVNCARIHLCDGSSSSSVVWVAYFFLLNWANCGHLDSSIFVLPLTCSDEAASTLQYIYSSARIAYISFSLLATRVTLFLKIKTTQKWATGKSSGCKPLKRVFTTIYLKLLPKEISLIAGRFSEGATITNILWCRT